MSVLRDRFESIHFGVGFVVFPAPDLDRKRRLAFQGHLEDAGLEINQVRAGEQRLAVTTHLEKTPLHITVEGKPGEPAILTIIEGFPSHDLSLFIEAAQMACVAYAKTWNEGQQVLGREVTIRKTVEAPGGDARKHLFLGRLDRTEAEIQLFGRPIHGFGMRFMMSPLKSEGTDAKAIELKVESMLADPKRLFVECVAKWPMPLPTCSLTPEPLMKWVDAFINDQVVSFMEFRKEQP